MGGLAFEETYIVIYVLAELFENGESSLTPTVTVSLLSKFLAPIELCTVSILLDGP